MLLAGHPDSAHRLEAIRDKAGLGRLWAGIVAADSAPRNARDMEKPLGWLKTCTKMAPG